MAVDTQKVEEGGAGVKLNVNERITGCGSAKFPRSGNLGVAVDP